MAVTLSMDPLAAKTVAATTGAVITALTMTPFDVVKTRMQTQPSPRPLPSASRSICCQPLATSCVRKMSSLSRPLSQDIVCLWEDGVLRSERVNGFWDAVSKVWRTEGARGLWKGCGTTLVMTFPSVTVYMVLYDHLLHNVTPSLSPLPSLVPLFAGMTSRTVVSSAATPLELLRTNLQSTPKSSSEPRTLRSVVIDLRGLVREQGVRSLWRGLGPTLWRDVPFSGLYWANYEIWKGAMEKRGYRGSSVAFTSGAISGTLAAFLTSPFDVLKTRRQALLMAVTPLSGKPAATSTIRLLRDIIRTEGISALYAGLTPRIAKVAPACGILIACFEGVGNLLSNKRRDDASTEW